MKSPADHASAQELLERVLNGEVLEETAVVGLFEVLLDPDEGPERKAALLAALRVRGETAAEIAGLARAMRARAAGPIPWDRGTLVDTCGTGGDGSQSFNLSTASALVVAALGIPVAKHGNRSVSSRCGSADLIEALQLAVCRTPDEAGEALARSGFAFLFAPAFHAATKAVVGVRRALATRTVFNLLGPLSNPARPTHQLIGAYSLDAAERMAAAARLLGLQRAFVIHGARGFDEATPCGPFQLFDVQADGVVQREVDPQAFGLARCEPEELVGGDAAENAELARALFAGQRGPLRDAVLLNAALVLLLVGRAQVEEEALELAARAIDDGRVQALLVQAAQVEALP